MQTAAEPQVPPPTPKARTRNRAPTTQSPGWSTQSQAKADYRIETANGAGAPIGCTRSVHERFMHTARKANLCLAVANDHVQQCGGHAQQTGIIAIGGSFDHRRAKSFRPSSRMTSRERGSFRSGKPIACGDAAAMLG